MRKRKEGVGETEEERVNSTLSKVAKGRKGKWAVICVIKEAEKHSQEKQFLLVNIDYCHGRLRESQKERKKEKEREWWVCSRVLSTEAKRGREKERE